jgi:hypothetical protein
MRMELVSPLLMIKARNTYLLDSLMVLSKYIKLKMKEKTKIIKEQKEKIIYNYFEI